jgi:hypothetical protein
MRRDLLIALLALAAGVGAALLVLGSERERTPVAASAAVALLVGWAYIGSGLIARRQRPENRLGTVLGFVGFAWFATFLVDAGSSLVFTLGKALESVYLLGFVYLVLSFPTGRLRSQLDRALIAAAVVLVTLVALASLLRLSRQRVRDHPQRQRRQRGASGPAGGRGRALGVHGCTARAPLAAR